MMTINVFGHDWNSAVSYGRLVTELADHLEMIGESVNRFGRHAPERPIKMAVGGVLSGYPTSFKYFGDIANVGRKIALTMFESDKIPDDWIEPLNACDVVVVPSTWLVDVFRRCGVIAPIEVLPLGVSKEFVYHERKQSDKFRIVAIGDYASRKGLDATLFSFAKAFGDDTGVELIVKAHQINHPFDNENIRVINESYDNAGMNKLYQSADMMIFPSAGEGFGLPPIEFAATGGVVAATDWSGMRDYIHQIGIPIPYQMTSAWTGDVKLQGLGQWAQADIDALADIMVDVRSWSQEKRVGFGRDAAKYTNDHFSWLSFASGISEIWNRRDDNQRAV